MSKKQANENIFLLQGWKGVIVLYTVMIATAAISIGVAQFGGGVLSP